MVHTTEVWPQAVTTEVRQEVCTMAHQMETVMVLGMAV
jgi:hypothetical protein